MDLPDWLDEDVIYNPAYWILTILFELAILIGFKAQKAWGGDMVDMGMSPAMFLATKLGAVLLLPIISYVIVKKFS